MHWVARLRADRRIIAHGTETNALARTSDHDTNLSVLSRISDEVAADFWVARVERANIVVFADRRC